MWLSICGDPDCPNKVKVEKLEREIERLKELIRVERLLHKERKNNEYYNNPDRT